jgi:carbonic anhydrase
MTKWMTGLKEFKNNVFPDRREMFAGMAAGQKPEAMMIACADSRVNPHMVTQTSPGELFVVRNAGNFIPPADAGPHAAGAAIELAIVEFGVHDLIVCGHSDCGAIKLLMNPELTEELPAMRAWLGFAENTLKRARAKYPDVTGPEFLTLAIEENVLVQLEHALTHPAVRRAREAGKLRLHGLIYDIESGDVYHYDHDADTWARATGHPLD